MLLPSKRELAVVLATLKLARDYVHVKGEFSDETLKILDNIIDKLCKHLKE